MNILLLEDDVYISNALKDYLEQTQGIECFIADTKKSARQLLDNEVFDIIFVDFILKDGFDQDFIKWIKEAFPKSTVVGFSALNKAKDISNEFKLDFFVPKPFNIEMIDEIISKSLFKNGLTSLEH